jgi:hypothetical protein
VSGVLTTAVDHSTLKRLNFYSYDAEIIDSSNAIEPSHSNIEIDAQIYETSDFSSIDITLGVNDKLDFNEGSGELTATISAGTYLPVALATEIETQLNATGALLYIVTYDSDEEKFTITAEEDIDILWRTGTNAASTVGKALGFDIANDDEDSSTFTSDYPYEIDYYDDLQTITATNFSAGDIISIYLKNPLTSLTITVEDGTDNINCGSNRIMTQNSTMMLMYDGSNWNMISFASNA